MSRVPYLRVGVGAGTTITVERVAAASAPAQGLVLDADHPLRAGGVEADRIVLWSTTAPPSAEIVTTAAGAVRIWNVWRDGDLIQAWEGDAGLEVDDHGDDLRLRCHDGHQGPDPTLELRLSFDRAWTQPAD